MIFQLWLDEAALTYGEFSFLSFSSKNPTQKFADSLLFFNTPPKDDFFEGRLDTKLTLRAVMGDQEKTFIFQQKNASVSGKVLQIKCRGGKVTQSQLMADWIDILGSDQFETASLLRYPIEAKYKLHSVNINIDDMTDSVKSSIDVSSYNPSFLKSEVARILADKRFWAKPKLTISGNLPTSCYLPSSSQSSR